MTMNVLVTGGAGYIGSHTCKALAQAGFFPVTYDNLSSGHEWAVRWGPLVRGDLADGELLRRTMSEYGIGSVLHFAGWSYVAESVHAPRKYYRNNLIGTVGLLDAMLDACVDNIVFSSTCATYGMPDADLLDETHPQRPVSPYGETKLAIERALHWYGQAYPMRFVALRYFNAAGADEDAEIGEVHEPETHLIPLVIEAAREESRELTVFGTDYPTPDGTAIRDYVHVSDLADAHVRALRYLRAGNPSACFNLGAGRGHSVLEIVAAVERFSGRSVPAKDAGRRAGDPHRLVADTRRAASKLGWKPQKSSLEAIIRTAWRWHATYESAEHERRALAFSRS
jgi:UDP-arabinose 4-epimerase